MTGSKPETVGDLVGLTISGGIAHFPGRAGERVRHFADLDPTLVAELLTAAEASDFFTRPVPNGTAPVRPDARTYSIRLVHADHSRVLTVPEPFEAPELAQLIRTVRRCLSGRARHHASHLLGAPDVIASVRRPVSPGGEA